MENEKIAEIFQEIGDILEIQGENKFKINAYHRAALTILNYTHNIEDLWKNHPEHIKEIPGIGESLAGKIEEIIKTGDCAKHRDLLKTFDKGLLDILRLRSVGPKKTKLFFDKLKIHNIEQLKKAAEEHKICELEGMGEKSESEIRKAITDFKHFQKRFLLPIALHLAEKIVNYLEADKEVIKAVYAGSLRRRKETIGDLDILAIGKNSREIIKYFCEYADVKKILAQGETKASVILGNGMQCDLRVVKEDEFGAALYYFTGSKEHNIATREIAKKMGLKISEYGIFKGNKRIAGKTEEEIFKTINLPYIEPELRENLGEIEAGRKGNLPKLIELKDLKGDLHMHSEWSDGANSIEEIAEFAKKAGLKYIAITDHSSALKVAHGLDEHRILKQMEEIERINKKMKDFVILKGCEVDILADGKLDLPDKVLAKLDMVIGSIHTSFKLSKEDQMKRILNAFKNPYLKIYGHPTTRLLNERNGIELDMEEIMKLAKKYGVALELDSHPKRLDLTDYHCRLAKEMGIKIVIDSDSHDKTQIANLQYGIFTARRGWIEKGEVLNTREAGGLMKGIRKKNLNSNF